MVSSPHTTPNSLAHLLKFTHLKTPEHPDKNLLQEKIAAWRKLHLIPTDACLLATSKTFTANKASCLLEEIHNIEKRSTLAQEHLSSLNTKAFLCSALDLHSTLPLHHTKDPKPPFEWLNLELPNSKRLSHYSSKITHEQQALLHPSSSRDLNAAKAPTEKKLSLLSKALEWIKTPLDWIEKHKKWLPEATQLSLPQNTRKLMQSTLQGVTMITKSQLGKGSFGSVVETSFGDRIYAQKATLSDNNSKKRLEMEGCAYMAIPPHPHLVSLKGITSQGLLLEKVSGGTLQEKITDPTITSKELINYCLHVTSALRHLHNHGFTYKDLKPENVLVDDSSKAAKLCDLGLIATTSNDKEDAGSLLFKAPEIYSGRYITTKADSWSFGVMLYELLTGGKPFPRIADSKGNPVENAKDYKERQYKNRYMQACPDTIFSQLPKSGKQRMKRLDIKSSHFFSSSPLQSLIKHCLHGDPKKRLSMEQIHTTLLKCQALALSK